jgi:hypothetical protein
MLNAALHGEDISCSHGEYKSKHILRSPITLPTVFFVTSTLANIRTLFLQAQRSGKAAILGYQLWADY